MQRFETFETLRKQFEKKPTYRTREKITSLIIDIVKDGYINPTTKVSCNRRNGKYTTVSLKGKGIKVRKSIVVEYLFWESFGGLAPKNISSFIPKRG